MPYFCQKLRKMSQNLLSAAVVIGALRVKEINFNGSNTECWFIKGHSNFLLILRKVLQYLQIYGGSCMSSHFI